MNIWKTFPLGESKQKDIAREGKKEGEGERGGGGGGVMGSNGVYVYVKGIFHTY